MAAIINALLRSPHYRHTLFYRPRHVVTFLHNNWRAPASAMREIQYRHSLRFCVTHRILRPAIFTFFITAENTTAYFIQQYIIYGSAFYSQPGRYLLSRDDERYATQALDAAAAPSAMSAAGSWPPPASRSFIVDATIKYELMTRRVTPRFRAALGRAHIRRIN